jgi:hypothetical protein
MDESLSSFRACLRRSPSGMVGTAASFIGPQPTCAALSDARPVLPRANWRPPLPAFGGPAMQPTHNTLSENIRAQSVELLNKHRAASIDLHAQVKQAHRSVRGPGFIAIHELFDKVSVEVEKYSDLIAEPTGGLGGTAAGTIQVAAGRTFLVPYPRTLSARHRRRAAARIRCLRDAGRVRPIGAKGYRPVGNRWRSNHRRPVHRNLAWDRSAALVRRISHCS